MASFTEVHLRDDDRVKTYIEGRHRHHIAVPSARAVAELPASEVPLMWANNAESRIQFAEIGLRHMLAHDVFARGSVHYVTITPAEFVFEVGDGGVLDLQEAAAARLAGSAATFDVRQLQGLIWQALGSIPFIGMVEAGFYKRWGPSGPSNRDWISWHAHILVWGVTRQRLRAALDELHRRASMMPDRGATYVQTVSPPELGRKIVYSLKAPLKAKRVTVEPDHVDPTTGEVFEGRTETSKDWAGTGDRVRLLDVMAGRRLDQLLFGAGDGVNVVRAIRDEALTEVRAIKARETARERARIRVTRKSLPRRASRSQARPPGLA